MRKALAVAMLVGLVSVSSASFAQAPDGSGMPVAEEAQPYPQAVVDRPLLLPHGAEALVLFWTPTNDVIDLFDFVNMSAFGRFGTGRLELFGGFELRAKEPEGADSDALAALTAGGAFELGPDQVVRGTLTVLEPTNETIKYIQAEGVFQIKRKLAPRIAAVASGGLNFFNPLPDEPLPDPIWILSVVASGEGQIQLTPTLAAHGFVRAIVPIADSPEQLETENVFNLGLEGTLSLAPNLDAVGGVSVNDAFDDDQRVTWFFVGGAVRL